MSIHDINVTTIDGDEFALAEYKGKALLIVNVASKCGLTPQYKDLEELHERFGDKGLAVLGFPCNQFGGQEPGTEAEIKEFCSVNYDVGFPLFSKIEVNGESRHALYAELTKQVDAEGKDGDVLWNFEKFLVSAEGDAVARFRPMTLATSDEVVSAIEEQLG